MKLPNVDRAVIPEPTLVEYLLASEHRSGQTKAAFFESFGFVRSNCRLLADALRRHAVLFVIEGPLPAPDGRSPWVRCIWCVDEGDDVPRFITAYPMPRTVS